MFDDGITETPMVPVDLPHGVMTEEAKARIFEDCIALLSKGGDQEFLFNIVEDDDFLVKMAGHLGQYRDLARELQQWVIPIAAEKQDWVRFLRYALLACNLDGLAEILAEEDLLAGLVSQKGLDFALSIVRQLTDPASRVRAGLEVTSIAQDNGYFADFMVQNIVEDLALVSRPRTREEAAWWTRALGRLTRLPGGPGLVSWGSWLSALQPWPHLRHDARLALLESKFLEHGPRWFDSDDYLADEGDPEQLEAAFPCWLTIVADKYLQETLTVLNRLPLRSASARWRSRMVVLSRIADKRPADAMRIWQGLQADETLPWSVEMVELGANYLENLPEESLQYLIQTAETTSVRLALRYLRPRDRLDSGLLSDLNCLAPSKRLYWLLRFLLTLDAAALADLIYLLQAISQYIYEIRGDITSQEAAWYLDLLDKTGGESGDQVINLCHSPFWAAERLLQMIPLLRRTGVLHFCLKHAERLSTQLCEFSGQAVKLRTQLLIRTSCRLCSLTGSTQPFFETDSRLLPEDQDRLRYQVAELFFARGDLETAWEIGRKIVSRRLLLRATLRFASREESEGKLTLANLFAALSRTDFLENERLAMVSLNSDSDKIDQLLKPFVLAIKDMGRRAQAVMDLGQNYLAYQDATFHKSVRDRLKSIQFLEADWLTRPDDEHRLELLPELLDLLLRLDPERALTELREGLVFIFSKASLPFRKKIQTFGELLSCLRDSPAATGLAGHRPSALFGLTLVQSLLLPVDLSKDPIQIVEIRKHWHILVAMLLALDLTEEFNQNLRSAVSKHLQSSWTWLNRKQVAIIGEALGEPGPMDMATGTGTTREMLEARAWVYVSRDPERIESLILQMESGLDRDNWCASLIKQGWLPIVTSRNLLPLIVELALRLEAELWLDLRRFKGKPDERWLNHLTRFVQYGYLDIWRPGSWSLIRQLRRCRPEVACPALVSFLCRSLSNGNRLLIESILKLWLNVWLAHPSEEFELRNQLALEAIIHGSSLTIGPHLENQPIYDQ